MKILTSVVNNPIFIEIQYYTFKKFLNIEYEFIVFNDAEELNHYTNDGDLTMRQQIREMCNKLGIKCIEVPKHKIFVTDHSIRAQETLNYVLDYQIKNPNRYLLVDSDLFLIDYFDCSLFDKYNIIIVEQIRQNIVYFWNGLFYMNTFKINNPELMDWSVKPDFDVGGRMNEFLQKQDNEKIYRIRHLCSCNWDESNIPPNLIKMTKLIDFFKNDPRNINGKFFCEIYENMFLHYRAGGNWLRQGIKLHNNLSQQLHSIIINMLK